MSLSQSQFAVGASAVSTRLTSTHAQRPVCSGLRLTVTRLPEHARLPMDSPIRDNRTALSRRAGEDAPIAPTRQGSLARSGRYENLPFFDVSLHRDSG